MNEIFFIWLSDYDWAAMPYIYEICIASVEIMNPNRHVVIYTNHDLHLSFLDRKITEVRKLQDYFPGLYEKTDELGIENKAHKSDYIRFTILKELGGIYLDTDVLCYDSIDGLVEMTKGTNTGIMFTEEDDNMICNAFIMKWDSSANEVLEDILNMYENNYIKHSYLFNSQKYLQLMIRRYRQKIFLLNQFKSIYKPSWNADWTEFDKLMQEHKIQNVEDCRLNNFDGIGFHLYSSVDNWLKFRAILNTDMYNKNDNRYIVQLTSFVINEYIKLMKEVDIRDKE